MALRRTKSLRSLSIMLFGGKKLCQIKSVVAPVRPRRQRYVASPPMAPHLQLQTTL